MARNKHANSRDSTNKPQSWGQPTELPRRRTGWTMFFFLLFFLVSFFVRTPIVHFCFTRGSWEPPLLPAPPPPLLPQWLKISPTRRDSSRWQAVLCTVPGVVLMFIQRSTGVFFLNYFCWCFFIALFSFFLWRKGGSAKASTMVSWPSGTSVMNQSVRARGVSTTRPVFMEDRLLHEDDASKWEHRYKEGIMLSCFASFFLRYRNI